MMDGGEASTDGPSSRPDTAFRLSWTETLLLLVLAAVQFTHIVDFVIMMPLGPLLKSGFRLTDAEFPEKFGNLVASYAGCAAVAGLLAAFVMDRFDRKRLLLVLYAGFVVGTGLCALAPDYATLLLARGMAGAFGGVGAAATLAIVGDAFPDSRRGTAMGILMSAFSVASIVGVPTGMLIADVLVYWQAPFAVLAGLGVVVLCLIQRVLPSMPRPTASAGTETEAPLSVLSRFLTVLLRPGHLLAYVFMTALVMGTFTIVPSLPTYLVDRVGMDECYLKYIYLCGGVGTLLTLTWVGRLSDRLGKRPVFRVLAACTVVPLLLITNLPAGLALPLVLGVTTLFMVTSSARMVPAMALITASAEPRLRGSFMSINSAVQQMALALAAVVGGHMITWSGYPSVGWLAAGVTLATVFMVGFLRLARHGEEAVVVVEAPAADSMPEMPDALPATAE